MIKKLIPQLLLFFFISNTYAQRTEFSSELIPEELTRNANSVVRFENFEVEMTSQREMFIKMETAITIFNKHADRYADVTLSYDKRRVVKNVSATIYDSFGKEIKKIKRRDFKDYSASDGFSLYNDGRFLHYDYTPISYPYTIYYHYEIKTSNTAFIPRWYYVSSYYKSIENSTFTINYPEDIILNKSAKNFDGFDIEIKEEKGKISYIAKNVMAMKREPLSPSIFNLVPTVKFGVNKFNLEGVDGEANNWREFGKWYYDNLIASTLDLPESAKLKIKSLTSSIVDPVEKAKIVYEFVQDKVRYISVQIGVGGFKPMKASAVESLGYGDCKALTNYTSALLKEIGIESYHTFLHAKTKRDVDSNVAAPEGNHMILYLPINGQDYWIECTTQNTPFGNIGDFTDDRDVIVIKPEGGELKHTRVYDEKENKQKIFGKYTLTNQGHIDAEVSMVCSGTQFDNHLGYEGSSAKELDKLYKEFWGNVNNMTIDKIVVKNNKKEGKFEELVSFTATNYGTLSGERMILPINAFNVISYVPKRIRDRKLPIQITRGFYDIDEVIVELPSDYKIEAIAENINIESKYGTYKLTIEKQSENSLRYKREFLLKNGDYPKEEYNDYRSFRKKIVKNDKSKIVLIKK